MNREQALKEMVEYATPPFLRPDEFTRRQFKEAVEASTGQRRSRSWITNRLTGMVERGILQEREVLYEGKHCKAYSLVGELPR